MISFRIDGFDLAVQRILKSLLPTPQFENINSSALRLLYGPTFTFIHDNWKKTIALTIWTFAGKVMYLLFNTLSRLMIVK